MMTIIFILLKSVLLIARFTGIFSGLENIWDFFRFFTFIYLDYFMSFIILHKFKLMARVLLFDTAFANEFVLVEPVCLILDIDLYIYLMREQLIDMNMYTLNIEREFILLRKIFFIKQCLLYILQYYDVFFFHVLKIFCYIFDSDNDIKIKD